MTIQEVQLTAAEWANFWAYYKGEPQQEAAIEMLRQYINEADPTLLTQNATWVQKYREQPKGSGFTPDKPFSYRVTEHITYGELCLNQESRRFTQGHQCETAYRLCQFAEKARTYFGNKPIIITSGHRPEPINSQVGGAPGSEHTYSVAGKGAIDFFLEGVSTYALQDWADKEWPFSLGYGAPKGFIHVGMRPPGERIRWNY